jgi:hypothetical protein
MTSKKPGPSPAYRELLKGQISPEEYVKRMKRDVNKRLGSSHSDHQRLAAG